MSLITLDSIMIKNNPSMFAENIFLDITFTSLCRIDTPLQWKIIYVGSASSQDYDQVLEEFEIGPFEDPSTMKFQIQCPAPDHNKIPYQQLLCVTALIVTVSFKGKEFVRVGYYVHNQFLGEGQLQQENYPILPILIAGTKRTIINDKPRITIFNLNQDKSRFEQQDGQSNPQDVSQQKSQRPTDLFRYFKPQKSDQTKQTKEKPYINNIQNSPCNQNVSGDDLHQKQMTDQQDQIERSRILLEP